MTNAVAYYRVSTTRQGTSGLGLEAQEHAVNQYCKVNAITVLQEFREIESGTKDTRFVLDAALSCCLAKNAVLLIAKLDRLGRNVAFISKLMESKVEFVAVDNPYAKRFMLHIMAAFAEHEREQISARTKSALQMAKLRGVRLGSYGRDYLSKANKLASNEFAISMQSLIEQLRSTGFQTIRQITNELNRRKIPTYRRSGKGWHIATVHNVLKRITEHNK